ncbi:MAG TPA: hypothetical protein VF316_24505 [Polyangiaceae bacterium]
MMTEIDAATSKTKHALHDATDTVAETAKTQSHRLEKFVRHGLRMLSLLPERTFERTLDRLGLMRKTSGLGAAALFAGGFAAGSVVTAFATPYSGSELRRKVYDLVVGLARSGAADEKAEEFTAEYLAENGRAGERVATGRHSN